MNEDFAAANRQRDVYLRTSDGSIVYVPKGWIDELCDDFDDGDGLCVYGYGKGMPVDGEGEVFTFWYAVKHLQELPEVTEAQARELYPPLFAYLRRINEEGRQVEHETTPET